MTAAVSARDLVLAHGSDVAIQRSSFEVPAGSVTVVIGPNGSGKSTLLNAIAGLIDPAGGTLEVAAGPQRISYVLQSTRSNDALPVTAGEVVTMGRYATAGARRRLGAEDRAAVDRAVARTGIATILDKHLHELSGGQRQRVFLAQGLAQSHDLLLLDEPLTGIDLPTAKAIDEVIHDERQEGCTVIISSHDLSEALVADHVLLLAGRVVAAGSPGEALATANLAEAYGASLLHAEDGGVFIDDPAHTRFR